MQSWDKIYQKEGSSNNLFYCQRCGTASKISASKLVGKYECSNCGFVFYQRPAPAVAALIIKNNSLLLVKRAIEPNCGKWTLPSGFVEYNEEPDLALKRELKEELGITISSPKIYTIKLGKDSPNKQILGMYYIVHKFSGKIKLDREENSDFRWFSLNKLPDIAFKANKAVVKKYVKEFV